MEVSDKKSKKNFLVVRPQVVYILFGLYSTESFVKAKKPYTPPGGFRRGGAQSRPSCQPPPPQVVYIVCRVAGVGGPDWGVQGFGVVGGDQPQGDAQWCGLQKDQLGLLVENGTGTEVCV